MEPSRHARRLGGRRGAFSQTALLPLLAMLSVAAPVPAAPLACEAPQGFQAPKRLESSDIVVLYRLVPSDIEVGRQFTVEAFVCAAPAVGAATNLLVDAYMPDHRHGMNYRPRVSRRGDGVYTAEGLLFHMPGQWQLRFDVEHGGRTERLSADIELE